MIRSFGVALAIGCDLIAVVFRSRAAVIAENLRRQLALYLERKTRRRRPTPTTKFALLILSRFFSWASALAIVKPDTFVRWHRTGFRLFCRWKSRHAGRPGLPKNLRTLITAMAQENPSWGEGRIADELSLTGSVRRFAYCGQVLETGWASAATIRSTLGYVRSEPDGECLLRAGDWQPSARVLGLSDSIERAASEAHPS